MSDDEDFFDDDYDDEWYWAEDANLGISVSLTSISPRRKIFYSEICLVAADGTRTDWTWII